MNLHRRSTAKKSNIKRITWQDKLGFRATKSLDSFHKTQFNFSTTWRMAVVYFLLYLLIAFCLLITRRHFGWIKPNGTIVFINFVALELVPLTFLGTLFGLKYHYSNVVHHFFTDFGKNCKRWISIFAHDAWQHRYLIIITVVLLLVTEIIVNKIMTAWFFRGITVPTENNKLVEKFIRQNRLVLIASTIIAPVAEELIFRFWFTDTFYDIVEHFWHGHFDRFVYWAGALLSALFFATEHLQGQIPIKGAAYLISALVFQWLAHRTHSLTAPVLVHSISNFIISIPMFL